MDFYFFAQVVAAVLIGNAATIAFALGLIRIAKEEAKTRDYVNAPLWVWPCVIIPPVIWIVGLTAVTV